MLYVTAEKASGQNSVLHLPLLPLLIKDCDGETTEKQRVQLNEKCVQSRAYAVL